jgi:hypothetical protein
VGPNDDLTNDGDSNELETDDLEVDNSEEDWFTGSLSIPESIDNEGEDWGSKATNIDNEGEDWGSAVNDESVDNSGEDWSKPEPTIGPTPKLPTPIPSPEPTIDLLSRLEDLKGTMFCKFEL